MIWDGFWRYLKMKGNADEGKWRPFVFLCVFVLGWMLDCEEGIYEEFSEEYKCADYVNKSCRQISSHPESQTDAKLAPTEINEKLAD